jgi:hypothetical protein
MFRRKTKEPNITPEEEKKLKEQVLGKQPEMRTITQTPIESKIQPIINDRNATQYFIGKKEVIKERKTIETKSGQIIELPEESARTVVKEIYSLTQSDLLNILKGVDEDTTISQLSLKMLTNEL